MHDILVRLKPGSSRRGLLFLASIVWGCAGGILMVRGYAYDMITTPAHPLLLVAGIVGGGVFFKVLFQPISSRHVARILTLKPDRPCLFSFLSWRSYALMAVMMSSGILLRSSGIVPQQDLGSFYIAMGFPLCASSVRFLYRGVTLPRTGTLAQISEHKPGSSMS